MKSLTKTSIVIGFVIVLSVAFFYYIGQKGDASVMQVQVQVKGDISNATITDITARLEKVTKISVPQGTLLEIPGVTVVVLQDKQIIGDWTSVKFNGTGTYSLTVGLTKNTKPGETVQVIARVMDSGSQNVAVVEKYITLT